MTWNLYKSTRARHSFESHTQAVRSPFVSCPQNTTFLRYVVECYLYAYKIVKCGRLKIVVLERLCEWPVNGLQMPDVRSGHLQHYAGRFVRKEKDNRLKLLIQIQLVLVSPDCFVGLWAPVHYPNSRQEQISSTYPIHVCAFAQELWSRDPFNCYLS